MSMVPIGRKKATVSRVQLAPLAFFYKANEELLGMTVAQVVGPFSR